MDGPTWLSRDKDRRGLGHTVTYKLVLIPSLGVILFANQLHLEVSRTALRLLYPAHLQG